jgi:hypothetical protein
MVVKINKRRDAFGIFVQRLGRLRNPRARKIAKRFGPVLVSAGLDDPIDLGHQIIVHGNRNTLHLSPRSLAPQFVLMVMRSKRWLVMPVRVVCLGLMEALMIVVAIVAMLMHMGMFVSVRMAVRM